MILRYLSAALVICVSASAFAKAPKATPAPDKTAAFEAACVTGLKKHYPKKDVPATCACVVRALRDNKVTPVEYELLEKRYAGSLDVKEAQKKHPKIELEELLDLEAQLAFACLDNPKFKVERQ